MTAPKEIPERWLGFPEDHEATKHKTRWCAPPSLGDPLTDDELFLRVDTDVKAQREKSRRWYWLRVKDHHRLALKQIVATPAIISDDICTGLSVHYGRNFLTDLRQAGYVEPMAKKTATGAFRWRATARGFYAIHGRMPIFGELPLDKPSEEVG